MSKVHHLGHEFVDVLPRTLRTGVLYIAGGHDTVAHLCCCGCGEEVVTPLSSTGWTLRYDGTVTLSPSVGNGALPCRSHYVIAHDAVRWLSSMTPHQHETAKRADLAATAAHHRRGPWHRLARWLRSRVTSWGA